VKASSLICGPLASQGFWGLIISAIALPLVTVIKDSNGVPLDDAVGAWHEVAASWQLQASILASIVSVRGSCSDPL
jgi:hypothetical protein